MGKVIQNMSPWGQKSLSAMMGFFIRIPKVTVTLLPAFTQESFAKVTVTSLLLPLPYLQFS